MDFISNENPNQIAKLGDKISVSDLFSLVKTYDKDFKPKPCSAVLNDDGTPKIMYRGDAEEFTVFDRKKSRYSNLYGRGFYFTDSKAHAMQYGNAREFYLNIRNPLKPNQHKITQSQLTKFLELVAEDEDYDIYNYGTTNVSEIVNIIYGKGDFEMLQDISATAIGDLVETIELFNAVNNTKYDGVILPTETVVYNPNNIKSVENGGTFSSWNDDVLYSKEYWIPDLPKNKLNTLYRMIDKDAKSSVKYITDTAKWLYTNIDGTKVFAIYSVENISKPTLLYESKGKQGEFERDELLELLKELDDGKDTIGRADIISEILSGNWVQKIGSLAYSARSVGGTRGNSDVRVLPTPSKRKPRGAFVSVIKNLFGIQERAGEDVLKSKEDDAANVPDEIPYINQGTKASSDAAYFELPCQIDVQKKYPYFLCLDGYFTVDECE